MDYFIHYIIQYKYMQKAAMITKLYLHIQEKKKIKQVF